MAEGSENLRYAVVRHGVGGARETVALTATLPLAYAAYYQAMRETPDRELELRHAGRALAHHQPQRSGQVSEPTAFYNLDAELRFTSANPAALALWRKTLDDIVGRKLGEAFPEAIGSDAYEAHLTALRTFRPYRGLVRSPVIGQPIRLEIVPLRAGLAVSFVREPRSQAAA